MIIHSDGTNPAPDSSRWTFAASASELCQQSSMALRIRGRDIGLFALAGEYYAIENACPHAAAYSLLSSGHIREAIVECPYHNAQFHIPTGRCLKQPGRDLQTYQVKQHKGDIYICI